MALKLPEPVPYDEIDKYLDEKFKFSTRPYFLFVEDDEFGDVEDGYIIHSCRLRDGVVGNHIGLLFSIKSDDDYEEPDAEGYCEWWGAREWGYDDLEKWHANEPMELPYEFTGRVPAP